MIRCTACKDPLPSASFVTCAGCDGGFHFGCSGLSRNTWNSKGASKKLEWRCRYCRRASKAVATPGWLRAPALPDATVGGSGVGSRSSTSQATCHEDSRTPQMESGVINIASFLTNTPTPFHTTLATFRRNVRIIPRIPKGARILAAEQLAATILSVVNNNDEASWQRLLLFSFAALKRPDAEKRVSLTTRVKNNISAFAEKNNEVCGGPPPNCKQTRRSAATIVKRAEAKLGDGDVRGAVRILCSEDNIASYSPETLEELKKKHPPARLNPSFPAPPPPLSAQAQSKQRRTAELEVIEAVNSFAAGSAGGLDGLRPQHLKDLLSAVNGEAASKLAGALAGLIDLMLDGRVPAKVCPYLYGATLTPLKKKDGSIRPIAVGNTLRRLASKIGCRRSQAEMGAKLRPHQMGFGTPGGAEAVVHAARRFVGEPGPPRILLKLDFKNAFNSMHRDHMLNAVAADASHLYPLAWQCYRDPSILSFGDATLESAEGCQQGDPCGPMFFCLGLQPLCRELRSILNVWYLDDGTLGGSLDTIVEDIRSTQAFSKRSGLILNPTKCEVFFIDHSADEEATALESLEALLPGIRHVQRQDLRLLGSPLTEEAIPYALREKDEDAVRMGTRLKDCSAHNALFLLKNCFAVPKLTYIARTCPSWLFGEDLRAIDETFRSTLQDICNTAIDGATWLQASLPVNKGGLGIRRIEELALPAFLASSYSTSQLVAQILSRTRIAIDGVNVGFKDYVEPDLRVAEAESAWLRKSEELSGSMFALPPVHQRGIQKRWDEPLTEQRLQNLLSEAQQSLASAETHDPDPGSEQRRSAASNVARLMAAATKESGLWLQALPSPSLGTLLDSDSIRVAVALRLGAPICADHTCRCGAPTNQLGHHGLSCKVSAGRHPRHHALNDVVRRALATAGVPSRLEPTGLAHDAGLRADGLTLVPWSRGKSLAWDATCVDTFAASHLASTSRAPRAAADGAENLKREKYRPLADRYIFVPLGFETMGTFGTSSSQFIREVGGRISSATGEKRATEFLRQRLSIEIQKGNATAIFGTFPPSKSFEEMFLLL